MDVNSAEFRNAHEDYLDSMADTQDDGYEDYGEAYGGQTKAEAETEMNCAPYLVEWTRSDGREVSVPFQSLIGAEMYAIIVRGSHRTAKIIHQ